MQGVRTVSGAANTYYFQRNLQGDVVAIYDTSGNILTVTHQAEGDDITASTAKALGFYVIKGEPATDIDTLIDTYESEDYTCVEK